MKRHPILDFGFWILDWLPNDRTELEIRQNFLINPFSKGGLKPLFFGQISLSAIALSILLLGCAASVPAQVGGETLVGKQPSPSPVVSSSPTNAGQMLPISAQTEIKGQRILLEVARTSQQQQMGLMYRTSLAANRGMLFSFDPPRPVSFWMKNTKIPLDMIFLGEGKVKAIAANVPPCTADPCPSYGPQNTIIIDQVIELRAGRAAELGLKAGDRVSIKFLNGNTTPATHPSS
jgi:uncharacterized membrane protein (UPF0127 family)